MAVFLAVGGLLSGILWSSFFVAHPAGVAKEHRVEDGSPLIAQAEGAEIDSAALTPQSAPFLASASAGTASAQLAEDTDVLYGEGALRDPGQAVKAVAVAPNLAHKPLASGIIYKISTGDTLASLSAQFGVPMNTIAEFNPSVNFSSLISGTSIVIPSQADIVLFEG